MIPAIRRYPRALRWVSLVLTAELVELLRHLVQ